jgi:nuclear pore complex protein Nup160
MTMVCSQYYEAFTVVADIYLGSFWTETFFNDGGWGSSLRSLLPWQGGNTIRYGDIKLEQTTATSLAFSPDNSYLFTISLNHTLKAWNLANGKIDVNKDLLNEERQPQDSSKYLLDPSEIDLAAVIDRRIRPGDLFYVLTYSPVGSGQFKFWAAKEGTNGQLELEDLCPDAVLEPPAPSTEIWTLAQFKVTSTPQVERMSLWILWKNNTSYRVQNLEFDLRTISIEWNDEFWVTTTTETLRDQLLPEPSDFESKDSTDKWLEYLLYPERFTKATLEASLAIYEQSFGMSKDLASFKGKALEERLCSSIAATVSLGRGSNGNVDYEQYRSDVDTQWRRFYRIAAELDKQRGEATALVFDRYSDLPWVVTTDGITLIRDCSGTELLYHNRSNQSYHEDILQFRGAGKLLHAKLKKDPKDIAGLVNAACVFRETFSDRLLHTCLAVAEFEALQDPSYSIQDRIQSFYDRCGFASQVNDDDYNQLITALDVIGGLKALDTNLFLAVIDSIPYQVKKPREGRPLTTFGGKALVVGAQELINLHSTVLFDLLVLIVFLEVEADREEEPMEWFDAGSLYFKIFGMLRDHGMLKWLAKSSRLQVPNPTGEDLETGMKQLEVSSPRRDGRRATVLQDLFVDYMEFPAIRRDLTQPYLLTASLRNTFYRVFEPDGQKSNSSVTLILCNLLKTQNTGLASEFVRYLPNTPWATYLRGRVHLCKKEYSMAATYFRKSAYGLHSPCRSLDLTFHLFTR